MSFNFKTKEVEKLEKELVKKKDELLNLYKEKDEKDKTIKTLKKELEDKNKELSNVNNEMLNLYKENKKLKDQENNYKEKIKSLENEINEYKINKKDIKDINHEGIPFQKGESYFQSIKDYNVCPERKNNNKKINNNKKENIRLFFSLKNIKNPKNQYSFAIYLINNKKINQKNFVGELENKSGKNIEFGTNFEIDYFFEREQIIIIEPIINKRRNKEKIVLKLEFPLSELMKSENNILSKEIENIGKLEISYINLKNQDEALKTEISYFQFGITLTNKNLFQTNELKNIFYVIQNFKDGNTKRPVYKSKENDIELNKKLLESEINFKSDILCNNKNEKIIFELYDSKERNNILIGEVLFYLNQLESDFKDDKLGKYDIRNKNNEILGQ